MTLSVFGLGTRNANRIPPGKSVKRQSIPKTISAFKTNSLTLSDISITSAFPYRRKENKTCLLDVFISVVFSTLIKTKFNICFYFNIIVPRSHINLVLKLWHKSYYVAIQVLLKPIGFRARIVIMLARVAECIVGYTASYSYFTTRGGGGQEPFRS